MQKCPLCKEDKILVAQGLFKVNDDAEPQTFPDRGYSFCNCKNIWFTDWANIDTSYKFENESVEVLQYYLKKGIIKNKGYGKNKFSCLGNAPKTKQEAERLGFETADANSFDIIWSYHMLEHERYPLTMLQAYYELLNKDGILFIAMPDPFFIDFSDIYEWGHWLMRENYIMWDMDSFCDEAEGIGFKIEKKIRNTEVKLWKDQHLIFKK